MLCRVAAETNRLGRVESGSGVSFKQESKGKASMDVTPRLFLHQCVLQSPMLHRLQQRQQVKWHCIHEVGYLLRAYMKLDHWHGSADAINECFGMFKAGGRTRAGVEDILGTAIRVCWRFVCVRVDES